jgi:hypothetical protein
MTEWLKDAVAPPSTMICAQSPIAGVVLLPSALVSPPTVSSFIEVKEIGSAARYRHQAAIDQILLVSRENEPRQLLQQLA